MLCQINLAHSAGSEQSHNAIPGEQLPLPQRHSRMIREPRSACGSLAAGAALTCSLTPQPFVLAVGRSDACPAPRRPAFTITGVCHTTGPGAAGSELTWATSESRFTQFAALQGEPANNCGRRSTPHRTSVRRAKGAHATALTAVAVDLSGDVFVVNSPTVDRNHVVELGSQLTDGRRPFLTVPPTDL